METLLSKIDEQVYVEKGWKILTPSEKKALEEQCSSPTKKTELRGEGLYLEEYKRYVEIFVSHTVYQKGVDPNIQNINICKDYQDPKPNIDHLCIDFFNRAYRTPLAWRSSFWFSDEDLGYLANSCKVHLYDTYTHRVDQDGYELTLKSSYPKQPFSQGDLESLKRLGYIIR